MGLDTSLAERADALLRDLDTALHDDAWSVYHTREDWQHGHVADLGSCDRQTAMRRQGFAALPHDDATLGMFEAGLWYEERMMRAFAREIPDLMRGIRIAMWPDLGHIGSKIVDESYLPQAWEMLGHPDGVTVARGAVIEAKSTAFWNFRPPTFEWVFENKRQWVYQTAAYALALRKPLGILSIVCRGTNQSVRFALDPRTYEATIAARMVDVLATTVPDKPIPEPTLPQWSYKLNKKTGVRDTVSWFCKYCPYAQCDLNPRHTNGRVYSANE